MKSGKFLVGIIFLFVFISSLTGCAMQQEQSVIEKTDINTVTFYGVKDPQISLIQILADELGYFQEEGLKVENVYLSTVQDLAPLMVNGQVEIACATNYSAAIWNMNGADIEIVAPIANIGGTQCILINSNIKIMKPQDLEGLRIGLLSGSTQQLVFTRMCKELELDINSFEVVPLQFVEQLTAISNGQVDMIATTEPWITKTQDIMDATVLCSGVESYIPNSQEAVNWCNAYSCIIVQKKWLENNKENTQKIIRAMNKAVAYVNENRETAVEILAKKLEFTTDEMSRMMENNKYAFVVDDTYLSTSMEIFDYITGENIVNNTKNVTPEDYHDFSILKETIPDSCKGSIYFY